MLAPAVVAYLETNEEMNPLHVAAMRAYLRQWIERGDWKGPQIKQLRRLVNVIETRRDIAVWLEIAGREGIDPL